MTQHATHGSSETPAPASARNAAAGAGRSVLSARALRVALLITVLVALYSPMLSIHPWGDDFENLHMSYPIHEAPWRACELNFVLFRPVTMGLMYLVYLVSGTHPLGYNLLTMALVMANVLLLWAVARRLGLGPWAAIATAALYGSSPLMSEATTWSGTRADQVLVLWTLLLLLAALRPWHPTSLRFQLVIGALLVAAAATKENWIVLPIMLGVTLLLIRRHTVRNVILGCTFGGLLAVVYVLYFVVWPELAGVQTPLDYSSAVNGPLAAVLKLLRMMAWYSGFGHPVALGAWGIAAGAAVSAALVSFAVRSRCRAAQLGVLILLLHLVPSLHFPVSPTRFNALPLLGFWIAVVALTEHYVVDRPTWRRAAAALAVAVCVVQAGWLRLEIGDYQRYGELHHQLVVAVGEIEDLLQAPGFVVVINAGAFNGPEAFLRSVRGLTKYAYPKPGGMWNLIFFHSLAEFAGRPFELRLDPVPSDRVTPEIIDAARVFVFRDEGFSACDDCREGLRALVASDEPLPLRIAVVSVSTVGSPHAQSGSVPRTGSTS